MSVVIKTIAIVVTVLGLFALECYGIFCANEAYDIMWGDDMFQQIIGTLFLFIGGNFTLAVFVGAVCALTAWIYESVKGDANAN